MHGHWEPNDEHGLSFAPSCLDPVGETDKPEVLSPGAF